MSRCDHCGAEILGAALFTCNFCEEDLCGDHRLPEAHNCVALRATSATEVPLRRDAVLGEADGEASDDPDSYCPKCGDPTDRRSFCQDCAMKKINSATDASSSGGGDGAGEDGGDDSPEMRPCERCSSDTHRDQFCQKCATELVNESSSSKAYSDRNRKRKRQSLADRTRSLGEQSASRLDHVPRPGRRSFLAGLGIAALGGGYARREDVSGVLSGIVGWFDSLNDFDADDAALEIHTLVNEEREHEGLSPLDYSDALEDDALAHSVDMAENDYFGHGDSGGRSLRGRVDVACGTIAENVAQSWVFQDVETAAGRVEYIGDETELAENVVQGWMLSPGHRENILRSGLVSEGIGVHRTEDNEVFVTQLFCGR